MLWVGDMELYVGGVNGGASGCLGLRFGVEVEKMCSLSGIVCTCMEIRLGGMNEEVDRSEYEWFEEVCVRRTEEI